MYATMVPVYTIYINFVFQSELTQSELTEDEIICEYIHARIQSGSNFENFFIIIIIVLLLSLIREGMIQIALKRTIIDPIDDKRRL